MNDDISQLTAEDLEHYINSGGVHKNPPIKEMPVVNESVRQLVSVPPVEQSQPSVEQPVIQEQQSSRETLTPTRAEGFAFDDPVELLWLLDDDIREGRIKLHGWQVEFMLDFAKGGSDHEHPFHALVRAANGSGKDKYVIAACAVWLCMHYLRANCPITSSSGQQLDTQTCRHITYLCEQANRKLHPDIWKINYRHYTCLATASLIDCFATDEPGKAEGFHPLAYGCKMALFMSEAKTVTDDINSAYDRCDGYTHRIHVSSPGPPRGHFYEDCLSSIPRCDLKDINDTDPSNWIQYLITAYDCSHISKSRIKKLIEKYGEDDPLVQSSVFAEFSSAGEMVVIPWNFVNQCVDREDGKLQVQWVKEAFNDAGLDLADGGDETVLIVRNGNRIINICPFRLDNSDDTYHHLDALMKENNLNNPQSKIFADCGGIGKPTLDRLKRNGWLNIVYVDNRHAAHDKFAFYKLATEKWWHLRVLCQRKEVILKNDKKLKEQLAGRYYRMRDGNLRHLLSKIEQKSKGYLSPDRADGTVLAFYRYKSVFKEEVAEDQRPFKDEPLPKPATDFTLKEYVHRGHEDYKRPQSSRRDLTLLREDIAAYNESVKQQNKEQYAHPAGNN